MRNYDKAYLFYKEFLQRHPEDVPALVSCAEMEMMRGKEKDALKTYETVSYTHLTLPTTERV